MNESPQRIRVGHSPDPDDAFMFYALARGKINTGRYRFEHELVDIETLNRRAMSGELELTALSLHAYAYLTDRYVLCTCGASMGDRYGPMLVARQPGTWQNLVEKTVVVPGTLTAAFLACGCAWADASPTSSRRSTRSSTSSPRATTRVARSMPAWSSTKASSPTASTGWNSCSTWGSGGSRKQVCRCRWEPTASVKTLAGRRSARSTGYCERASATVLSTGRRPSTTRSGFGRGLDRSKADQFVGMYVNDWTLDFGPRGREAVGQLLARGCASGVITHPVTPEFAE